MVTAARGAATADADAARAGAKVDAPTEETPVTKADMMVCVVGCGQSSAGNVSLSHGQGLGFRTLNSGKGGFRVRPPFMAHESNLSLEKKVKGILPYLRKRIACLLG